MPENIELKARAADWDRQIEAARALSDAGEELEQEDSFFPCARGRLKLRELGPGRGAQLIFYSRPDRAGPKSSEYDISPVADPATMRALLGKALGLGRVVRKRRSLLLVGQTRVHFDAVEGLGRFIELEVCLRPGQSRDEGAAIARGLMERLGIADADLIEGAYTDLLEVPRSY